MTTTAVRKRSEKRQRTSVIAVRVTPAEHAELTQRAAAKGTTVGALTRAALWPPAPPSKTLERRPASIQLHINPQAPRIIPVRVRCPRCGA